jgi:transposase-like protein
MKKKELQALAAQSARSVKTEKDFYEFSAMLKKITVEAALNAELDDYLGYERHQSSNNSNNRNGYSSKKLLTEDVSFDVDAR